MAIEKKCLLELALLQYPVIGPPCFSALLTMAFNVNVIKAFASHLSLLYSMRRHLLTVVQFVTVCVR